jgi:hypothetical protein
LASRTFATWLRRMFTSVPPVKGSRTSTRTRKMVRQSPPSHATAVPQGRLKGLAESNEGPAFGWTGQPRSVCRGLWSRSESPPTLPGSDMNVSAFGQPDIEPTRRMTECDSATRMAQDVCSAHLAHRPPISPEILSCFDGVNGKSNWALHGAVPAEKIGSAARRPARRVFCRFSVAVTVTSRSSVRCRRRQLKLGILDMLTFVFVLYKIASLSQVSCDLITCNTLRETNFLNFWD